jgi:alkylated DNA repair dioxygenase AlkB
MLFVADVSLNLLPMDGGAHYYGPVLDAAETQAYFQRLETEVPWEQDRVMMFGKMITTARRMAWYGDARAAYTYSGTTKHPLPWTPALLALKQLLEHRTKSTYNSCLLNLYRHGQESMGWHSDDEKCLDAAMPIASMSLGAERKFSFKHKHTKETISLMLESGSLLLMTPPAQLHWWHCLPKSARVATPRLNLTFRTIL